MRRPDKKLLRLVAFATLSITLIVVGALWAVRSSGVSADDVRALAELPATTLVLLATLAAALYGTDIVRYRVLGQAVGAPMSRRTALEASIVCFFFGWTTPGTAFGAPAAVVMLGRRGVPWDAAAVIALGKSLMGTAVVLGLGFVMLAAGLGPAFGKEIEAVLLVGTGIIAACLALPVAEVLVPGSLLAPLERFETWAGRRWSTDGWRGRAAAALGRSLHGVVSRLAHLRQAGAAGLLRLLASQVAYFAVFIGVAVVLAGALGAEPLSRVVGVSTVYVAFSYVAPTPGGAGLAEAMATVFYGSLLPPGRAVVVVLLFRGLTFYLHIAVGLLYLPLAGVWRQISGASREVP